MIGSDKWYHDKVVMDLGCGKGELYQLLMKEGHLKGGKEQKQPIIQKMFNYDLVASEDYIQV